MTGRSIGSVFGRRRFVLTAAGTVTGATVAGLARPSPSIAAPSPSSSRISPVPNPIPGGLELAPGFVIHVFPAGDPAVTLPFSQLSLAGFDAEPVTLTDFNGSAALAYHVGTRAAATARSTSKRIFGRSGVVLVDGNPSWVTALI
jgi:hypothetical protein